MVIYEDIGGGLVYAYSDKGVKIAGGEPYGVYDGATDPAAYHRVYTETDEPVDDRVDEADYIEALGKVGVKV